MKYDQELKQLRDKLINFLKSFKYSQLEKSEVIGGKFSFKAFYDACNNYNDRISKTVADDQISLNDVALEFIDYVYDLKNSIDIGAEFAFTFKDYTKWDQYVFYYPINLKRSLKARNLSVFSVDTQKEYNFPLSYFEAFKLWKSVSSAAKKIKEIEHNKMCKEFFKA